VFCDVDPETFCVTPDTVRDAMTERTKAVVVVHLFGNVAPVAEIEALGVPVLEDAAQAIGSRSPAGRPGALGTAATLSFFPSKNLGAFGDGGAITTRDDEIAERVRMLRFHGSKDKQTFELVGHNSRLDELQAAILRVQLPHLDGWADGRRRAAAHYEAAGLGELVDLPRALGEPAWHLYVVRHARSDELAAALKAAGVGHKAYYRVPTHLQPAMRDYAPAVDLAGTAEAARTHLAIPMSPVLSREQAAEVVAAIGDAGLGRPH
jgi:dTDP-4-amino-4,6-dideoxygalactose transaminase